MTLCPRVQFFVANPVFGEKYCLDFEENTQIWDLAIAYDCNKTLQVLIANVLVFFLWLHNILSYLKKDICCLELEVNVTTTSLTIKCDYNRATMFFIMQSSMFITPWEC